MNSQVNSCGTCRACCQWLKISVTHTEDEEEQTRMRKYITNGEETKHAPTPCPQLNKNPFQYGCSIHSVPDKPKTCSDYLCSYALGTLGNDKKLRPDNLGIIVDLLQGKQVRVIEIREKALEGSLAKKVMWGLMNNVQTLGEEGWKLHVIPTILAGTDTATETLISNIIPVKNLSIGK